MRNGAHRRTIAACAYRFGYKYRLDLGSGLVHKALLTSAKTNESAVADRLICGDEQCVHADKAYDSAARRQLLEQLGIADGIMRRARWGTARSPDPQLLAHNLAGVLFAVERSFATMHRSYSFRRALSRPGAKHDPTVLAVQRD